MKDDSSTVLRFVAHSKRVLTIASRYGWMPGARYTNLRDVRHCARVGFIDIEWTNYSFKRHLEAVKLTQPFMTVARDIENAKHLENVLDEAHTLALFCTRVVIVPKDPRLGPILNSAIPETFLLGFSVPSRYGRTRIPPRAFRRPVHLLGGRPDVQRRLGELMPVVSVDCNRFTIDAAFGDYFDGETFRPHPKGGYDTCIRDSVKNINKLWDNYAPSVKR